MGHGPYGIVVAMSNPEHLSVGFICVLLGGYTPSSLRPIPDYNELVGQACKNELINGGALIKDKKAGGAGGFTLIWTTPELDYHITTKVLRSGVGVVVVPPRGLIAIECCNYHS